MHISDDIALKNHFKFDTSSSLKGYINSILPYFENENILNEVLFKVKFEELLLNLILNDPKHSFKKFLINLNTNRSYNGLREFMEINFTRNLRIEDFAYLNSMSLSTFKRNFKKNFNASPSKWLKIKRLERAKFLLQDFNKNVNEVAMEVGFESNSHFIQEFKASFGKTPKHFQQTFE